MQIPKITPPKIAYSIKEACSVSTLSRSTIYAHINAGRLKVVKVGGRTLIPTESLNSLLSGGSMSHAA